MNHFRAAIFCFFALLLLLTTVGCTALPGSDPVSAPEPAQSNSPTSPSVADPADPPETPLPTDEGLIPSVAPGEEIPVSCPDRQPPFQTYYAPDRQTAYIPQPDGSVITVEGELYAAGLTGDQQHLVVSMADGSLYYTDPEQTTCHQIRQDMENFSFDLSSLCNEGFIFHSASYCAYRFRFSDERTDRLSDNDGFSVPVTADRSITALFSDTFRSRLQVCVLSDGDSRKRVISSIAVQPRPVAITADGQLAVWIDDADGSIHLYDRQEPEAVRHSRYIPHDAPEPLSIQAVFSADQKMVVVLIPGSTTVLCKRAGEPLLTVDLKTPLLANSPVCADGGYLSDCGADEVYSLYLEGENALYRIPLSGDDMGVCETVLSGVSYWYVYGGSLVYTDSSAGLYCADLEGSELANVRTISDAFGGIVVTFAGPYVYYTRSTLHQEETSFLRCYRIGETESLLVTENLSAGVAVQDYLYQYTADGTLFYLEDAVQPEGTFQKVGTLYCWRYGRTAPRRIADNVLQYSVRSLYQGGWSYSHDKRVSCSATDFNYMIYRESESPFSTVVDLFHFNGVTSTPLLRNILSE